MFNRSHDPGPISSPSLDSPGGALRVRCRACAGHGHGGSHAHGPRPPVAAPPPRPEVGAASAALPRPARIDLRTSSQPAAHAAFWSNLRACPRRGAERPGLDFLRGGAGQQRGGTPPPARGGGWSACPRIPVFRDAARRGGGPGRAVPGGAGRDLDDLVDRDLADLLDDALHHLVDHHLLRARGGGGGGGGGDGAVSEAAHGPASAAAALPSLSPAFPAALGWGFADAVWERRRGPAPSPCRPRARWSPAGIWWW